MNDVAFTIDAMIDTYVKDSGKRPAAILLGPSQYREFCYQQNSRRLSVNDTKVGEGLIVEYQGYPVFVKELPGIELALSYTEAFSAAYRI